MASGTWNKILNEQVESEKKKIGEVVKKYEKKKNKFKGFHPPAEQELVSIVNDIMKSLKEGRGGKGFDSWSGDQLYEKGVSLSKYYYHLLYYAAEHNARSSFVYSYRKLTHAQDFRPLKAEMKNELEKVTEKDVESVLDERFDTEVNMQIFEQRQADIFKALAGSTEKMITFIQQRISDMRTEKQKFMENK